MWACHSDLLAHLFEPPGMGAGYLNSVTNIMEIFMITLGMGVIILIDHGVD